MTKNLDQYREKRNALKELSKIAKIRISADCEGMTVNEVLISEFYTDEENEEFKTLFDWNKNGYQVLKGSIAFLIWGKPKPITKEKKNDDEDDDEFFPICYLFSNAQVKKRDAKK
jgi:hypothetical protein